MATQQTGPGQAAPDSMALMKVFADAGAACLTPFLRTRFGTEGIGVSGVAACVLIPFYAAFARAPEMFLYFAVWLVAVACQRVETLRLVWAGWREHSRYTGWPVLALRLAPGVRETTAKLVVEPLLCLAVGALLFATGAPAMGRFVMAGGVAILVATAIDLQTVRTRLRQMQDAELEMQQLARWHRRGRMDN